MVDPAPLPMEGEKTLRKDRMEIVVVWHGAVYRQAREWLREWSGRPGIGLTLVAPEHWSMALPRTIRYEASEEPFRQEVLPVRLARHGATFYYRGLRRVLDAVRPRVLVGLEEPYSVAMHQLVRWKRGQKEPVWLASYSYQNLHKEYPLPFRQLEKAAYRHIDCLLGCSPEVLDVAGAKGYTGPAEVVPHGVRVPEAPPDRSPASGRPFRVGYAGRLVPEKGIETLVEAVGLVPGERELCLAGEGPQEYVKTLTSQARGIPLEIRSGLNPDGVQEQMRTWDVLVLPSRTRPNWKEQFGRVLIEAMACGTPVVGSSSGAIPWVIGDGGLVFAEGDTRGLAECLIRLRDHPDEWVSLSRAGWERANGQFSVRTVVDRLDGIVRRALPA